MTQAESLRRYVRGNAPVQSAREHAHVTAVAAGKGGAGASTIAVLLASAHARTGRETLLVDADGGAGGLCALLGIAVDTDPVEVTLVPLTAQLTLALPPAGRDGALEGIERRVLYRRMLALFPAYDAVVIDAGARLETIAGATGEAAALLVVAAADRVSLAASYAALRFAAERTPHVRATVVINRAGSAEGAAAYRALQIGAERFLGRVPAYGGAIADENALKEAVEERRLLNTEVAAMHTLARLARRSPDVPRLHVT